MEQGTEIEEHMQYHLLLCWARCSECLARSASVTGCRCPVLSFASKPHLLQHPWHTQCLRICIFGYTYTCNQECWARVRIEGLNQKGDLKEKLYEFMEVGFLPWFLWTIKTPTHWGQLTGKRCSSCFQLFLQKLKNLVLKWRYIVRVFGQEERDRKI
jgi:hypothetical protein